MFPNAACFAVSRAMERIAIADFADVEPARPRLLSLIDEEQPDNLCVRIGVDRLLADAQLALNPIAILLDSLCDRH